MLPLGCRPRPVQLRIACSADMLPVVSALGYEFRDNFGVLVAATIVDSDDFAVEDVPNFDFILTDDLDLVAQLLDNGMISRTTDFACALPTLALRRSDNLPVLKLADLTTIDRPLRMTIASPGATLPQIVAMRFEQAGIPLQGDGTNRYSDQTMIQVLPFLVKEIRSDRTHRFTTPEMTLQQLADGKTDMVVFWDFAAADAIAKYDDADAFVTVTWPSESSDTITIPLGLVKDCTHLACCEAFMDFVKSRRGTELIQSCFLHSSDDLVGTR